jgi:putative ABC transport system permease protein
VEAFSRDFRFALRSLAKDRRFALVAIFALALGIGATTVIFSMVYNLLLRPFPYKNADRMITFSMRNLSNAGGSVGRNFYSIEEFQAFREQNLTFEDMAGYDPLGFLYSDGKGTRSFSGARVSANTLEFYGVPPLLGRGITPDDGKSGAPPVFVMNYRLWQTEFGGDPKILGNTFVLDGVPRTLVGIMPPRFDIYGAGILAPSNFSPGGGGDGTLQIVGRLKPGIGLRAAEADLEAIAHRTAQGKPGLFNYEQFAIVPETLVNAALGNFSTMLFALLAAVSMLLLIACINVANLLLARATIREREIAIRAALGASRTRLVRQLLAESFALSAAACIGGCVLAYVGLKAVVAIIPSGTVPKEAVIGMNPEVLAFALGVTVLTTLLCGVAPAVHAMRGDLQPRLTGSSKGIGGSFRHGKFRAGLVVTEVALSIVLLVGAGLMMRNFFSLTHENLPFNPANILYARLTLPRDRYYIKPDRKPAFVKEILPRIQALPGVVSVTESLMRPPNEGSWTDVEIPGKPHAERWVTDFELCTEGYFQTLGLQLLRGRLLSSGDIESVRYVTVVNQTLARQYFPGEDPIGQKIKFEVFDRPFLDAPHNSYFEIVGVIADFKTRPESTQYTLRPEAFLPASVAGFGYPLTILAKTAVDPHLLLKSVYREVWSVDPGIAFSESGSIEDFLNNEFQEPRFEFALMGALAGIGLLLVVIGIFSVMAYTVSLQTREIGVRLALGAQQSDILRMVLRKGLGLVATGSIIGVLASFGLTRFIASQMWGVSATDPWTFGVVVAVIVAVGLGACLLPARRATQVDPLIALRYE